MESCGLAVYVFRKTQATPATGEVTVDWIKLCKQELQMSFC